MARNHTLIIRAGAPPGVPPGLEPLFALIDGQFNNLEQLEQLNDLREQQQENVRQLAQIEAMNQNTCLLSLNRRNAGDLLCSLVKYIGFSFRLHAEAAQTFGYRLKAMAMIWQMPYV